MAQFIGQAEEIEALITEDKLTQLHVAIRIGEAVVANPAILENYLFNFKIIPLTRAIQPLVMKSGPDPIVS